MIPRRPRLIRPVLATTLAGLALSFTGLAAQGVSSAAIRGTVEEPGGDEVDGVAVTVENTATGFAAYGETRHGRFLVHGLEPGGPYRISLRRIGYLPQQRDTLFLTLGEPLELHFVLQAAAIPLDAIRVPAAPFLRGNEHGGTATTVSDSLLHRLPTLDRDLYDFVRLAPQVSTRIGFAPGGMSGGGVGFRFNNFLLNGVPQRTVPGGQPPEFAGARSVPLHVVREYQVLVAPFDVRYGDFAGALVNAVTRAGTNELAGSAFALLRNDALARPVTLHDDTPPYERLQYGLSLGGPLRRDRAHFLLAAELQHLTSVAPGPYVGRPGTATPAPVLPADLARLDEVMGGHGLIAGSAGPVENSHPVRTLFTRIDLALPRWDSRAVLWMNDSWSTNLRFSRPALDIFPLSTQAVTTSSRMRTTALELHTGLRRQGGAFNELVVSHRSGAADWRTEARQPVVRVTVPSSAGGTVTVVTGTPPHAQAGGTGFRAVTLSDNLTLALGAAHVATLGVSIEWFDVSRSGVANGYGTWAFSSLDSLAAGIAESFVVAQDFGSGSAPVGGAQYAIYAGDRWQAADRLSLTLGVRAEMLAINGHAPYNPAVDAIFGLRTDQVPGPSLHVSPRFGFAWDVTPQRRDRIRGGMGLFTGRPPVAWIHSGLHSFGDGVGVLRCGRFPTDQGPPPPFVPDYRTPPTSCANGADLGALRLGDVDLLDRDLRMAQTLRVVLAYERRLPWSLLGTLEALATRNTSDFVFVNLNLVGPRREDLRGRSMYGVIGPTGVPTPALRSAFSEVIHLRNTARNRSYQLSGRLEKRFSDGTAATAHYTFSRVRDVQTPLRVNTPGTENWASTAVSGRHEDLELGISLNDVPHRVVLAGTGRAPWRRWSTELSLYYVGESGSPFTYLAWGAGRRGDLNADGAKNDPIYVPRSALDTEEILFSGRSDLPEADNSEAAQAARVRQQQEEFEELIDRTPCLRRQRGRILERNSCREPWSHTTIASVRQAIPLGARTLEAHLDVYNALNLLSRRWGRRRVAAPALLEQVGQRAGPEEASQPVFRFDPSAAEWTTLPAESAFQLQFGLRFRF